MCSPCPWWIGSSVSRLSLGTGKLSDTRDSPVTEQAGWRGCGSSKTRNHYKLGKESARMTYSTALGHREDDFQYFFFFCECVRNISNLVIFHLMYSLIKFIYLDYITREQKPVGSVAFCFALFCALISWPSVCLSFSLACEVAKHTIMMWSCINYELRLSTFQYSDYCY